MTLVPSEAQESQLLRAALGYARRGWRVIPLHWVTANGACSCGDAKCGSVGKHPLAKRGLKDGTTDEATIRRWWKDWPRANVAVCTGPESGVWMLGPDGQAGIEALAGLERENGPLPPTPTQRSGSGGSHHVYAWPAEGTIKNDKNHLGLPIDVRGKGGYFVAAPSANGMGPYRWEVPPEAVEPAEAPAWLLQWIRGSTGAHKKRTNEAELGAVQLVNGGEKNGEKLMFTVGPDITQDVRARAIAYLKKCPPAVSGQGGHNQTFEVARAIVYGFGLGAQAGFNILWEHFNPRCAPPWSEAELRHKCEDADSQPFDKPRGYLLAEAADVPEAGPAHPAGGGFVLEVRCLDQVRPGPVEFLVDDYIPLGKVTLFAGCGGLGKSVATLDLAAAVTTGRCAFGLQYAPPLPADALLVFAEDDAADTVVPRLLAAGADLRRTHEVQGKRGRDGRRLPFSLADCDALAAELKRRPEARLVVIDPAGVFAGRTGIDTHKEAPVQAMLAELRDLALDRRVAVVLVAHVNKCEEQKARNRVSGSAAFVNSARAAFLFTEDAADEGGRRLVLPVKCNYGREPRGIVYGTRDLTAEELAAVQPALAHLDEGQRQMLLRQLFRIDWQGQTSETADEVLSRKRGGPKDADRAAEWLRTFLAARPVGSDECARKGNEALGMRKPGKWWRDSVLKPILGGKPRRAGFGAGGQWWFTLPSHPWPFPGLEGADGAEEPPAIIPGPLPGVNADEEPGPDGQGSMPSMGPMPPPSDSMASPRPVGQPNRSRQLAGEEAKEGIEGKESTGGEGGVREDGMANGEEVFEV
jgi:hypothetical protein